MVSIREARRRLPPEFTAALYESFPAGAADRILAGMGAERYTTLRVNTLKSGVQELLAAFRRTGVKHRRVPWCPEAFILIEAREREVEGWESYRQGRIYLQSLSSLIPALVLAPRPGQRVLDLAAAPGSKTTQMAALMGNRGSILAVELHPLRCERLKYNLALQGAGIVEVHLGPGEKIGALYPACFDRVLLDAPCSGEGRFLLSAPGSFRRWSPREVDRSARRQRKLLASAAQTLKPGGELVYSTCTLNRQENEEQVSWAVNALPLVIEEITLPIQGALPGLSSGLHPQASRCLRLLPSREHEGFFVCRMKKKE